MATLLDSVENSIWHAFDYLALEGDGTATKHKLKVNSQFLLIFQTNMIFTWPCPSYPKNWLITLSP